MKYDVVYYDTISHPFSRRMNAKKPCGGTELNHVKVVHGLADAGYSVLVVNNNMTGEVDGGVVYDNWTRISNVECRTLVVCRFSEFSIERSPIKFDRVVMAMNDQFQEWQRPRYIPGATVILNSQWHADNFPAEWPKVVVPALVDDFVYGYGHDVRDFNKFIYASAVCKGLRPTLKLWDEIRRMPGMEKAELHVTTAGHDRLPAYIIEMHGAKWIGELSPDEVLRELSTAAGLFFVNVLPETFCVLAAVAEAVGCRCHILALAGGAVFTTVRTPLVTSDRGEFIRRFCEMYHAMPAVLPHNFSTSAVIPQWIKALGLDEPDPNPQVTTVMGSEYENHEIRAKSLESRTDAEGILAYADACRDALMPERALDAYLRRTKLEPDCNRAWYEAAKLSLQLSLEDHETVPLVVEAAQREVSAIEFVRTYRERKNWNAMLETAKALFREDVWDTYDELGIAYYYAGMSEEGARVYEALLPKNIVPKDELFRVEMNYNFCREALGLPFYKSEATIERMIEASDFGASGYPEHHIGVYPNAVPLDLCADMMSVFDAAKACGCTHRMDFDWRRCSAIHLPHAELPATVRIRDRFFDALRPVLEGYKKAMGSRLNAATHIEAPSILLYEKGKPEELFKEHHDNWDIASSTRQLSVVLYLNDVEHGGATHFTELAIRVPPRAGTLLLFPSFYTHLHEAEPPISEDKLCVVTWLHFPGGQYAAVPL